MTESSKHTMALQDYVAVIRRRKWIILAAVVLVPLVAVIYSVSQTPVYEDSAKVLLSRQNLATSLSGITDPNASVEEQTLIQTQAQVARVPEIAERVVSELGTDMTAGEFLADSEVTAAPDTEILTFTVRSEDRDFASEAATAYAQQYAAYRHELDTASLKSAAREVTQRIEDLTASGDTDGALYASLLKREQQLRTLEALQTSNANVIETADTASQVAPRPMLYGALGLMLGAVLGLGLAFLREALDTRMRSADQIGERLQLPLLARIPEPPKKLRDQALITMADPRGPGAEAFRMLRTNLEFAMLDRNVRLVMVTSALAQEGKSTTAANLAVTFARSGQHVILVDLDLRRPRVERFFDLGGKPGLTQVVLKQAPLDAALARVPILPGMTSAELEAQTVPEVYANGGGGRLEVLGSGPIPPDPGEFVASHGLAQLLAELRERADLILIDSPPLLQVGDPMTLSAKVDALLIVARLSMLRRGVVTETHRILETARAHALGFVVTGAEEEPGYYGYGYGGRYGYFEEPAERETSVS